MQLKFTALLLFVAAVQAIGGARHKLFPPRLRAEGQAGIHAKITSRELESSGCSDGTITTTAPKLNIFGGLTDDEFANVTAFLHQQKFLNVTAVANATGYVSSGLRGALRLIKEHLAGIIPS